MKGKPTLFSYVIPHDGGSAPNPYFGICTLAICKPVIRRTAKVEDWVVGLGAKKNSYRRRFRTSRICYESYQRRSLQIIENSPKRYIHKKYIANRCLSTLELLDG